MALSKHIAILHMRITEPDPEQAKHFAKEKVQQIIRNGFDFDESPTLIYKFKDQSQSKQNLQTALLLARVRIKGRDNQELDKLRKIAESFFARNGWSVLNPRTDETANEQANTQAKGATGNDQN